MTSLALLAVLLAAGWYFYRHWRYTRFEALHHPGHPQYCGAALCSVYLFGMSVGLHALAMKHPAYSASLGQLHAMLPLQAMDKQTAEGLTLHLGLTLWSVLLGTVLPILLNDPLIRVRSLAQLIAWRQGTIDAVEALAIQSEDDGTLVALTLENGKVYIGLLDEYTGLTPGKEWVGMKPVASGYWDNEAKLSLTTFHDAGRSAEPSLEIFQVIASTKQIISVQAFDLELCGRIHNPDLQEDPHRGMRGTRIRHPSTVDNIRHCLYLGLPIVLLLSPYIALKSVICGLSLIVSAGVSCMAAERLRSSKVSSDTEDTTSLADGEPVAAWTRTDN